MEKISKEELSSNIKDFKLPRYDQIPDIGLFLDQTTKYISKYLKPLKNTSITNSMISNYVKQKIVSNPIKKQYYPDQIAYLIFIAITKSVLSLENVELLLKIQKHTSDIKTSYDYFCNEFESAISNVFEMKNDYNIDLDKEVKEEKIILRNMIMTVVNKIYLDEYLTFINTKFKN